MNDQPLLRQLYQDFNARHIDAVLAHFHTNVTWPNGWEGGYLAGHDAIRAYWLRQWNAINPIVEPLSIEVRSTGQVAVKVHQRINDVDGQLLSDDELNHVYSFDNGKMDQG